MTQRGKEAGKSRASCGSAISDRKTPRGLVKACHCPASQRANQLASLQACRGGALVALVALVLDGLQLDGFGPFPRL